MKNMIVIVLMVLFLNIYSSERNNGRKLSLPLAANTMKAQNEDTQPKLASHNSSSSLDEFPKLNTERAKSSKRKKKF